MPSASAVPSYGAEARTLARLALPAAATQVGTMMLGVVDTIVVGHVGVDALAAATIGHAWTMTTLLFGLGIVIGIEPLVSQGHGARRPDQVALALQSGLVVGLAVSVVVGTLWMFTGPVLVLAGQDPALAERAHRFTVVQVPTVPCFYVSQALRVYLQGRTIVTPTMWVMVPVNLLNLFFNWVLVFGHLGAPALGLEGSGLATGISRAAQLVLLLLWIRMGRLHENAWTPWTRRAIAWRNLSLVLRVGIPLGFQFALEGAAFNATLIMAGWLGERELAASGIVLNMASLTFMMPLGVAIAAATRVGNLVGAADAAGARRAIRVAFVLGIALMSGAALVFVGLRWQLPRLYSVDDAVIALAASLLPAAAAFQVFDGTQVVGAGLLRGMGRTRVAALANLVGYYVVALPLGAWLAFRGGFGLPGIWWGMAAGLACVAALIVAWVRAVERAPIRLEMSPGPEPS